MKPPSSISRARIAALPVWLVLQGAMDKISVVRMPRKNWSLRRFLGGGRLTDFGRLPRYLGFFCLGATFVWAPITGYLKNAPLQFSSEVSLILPGSGASASINLNDIGQASSFANSAFSSNSVSPTETYKRLIGADRILASAAAELNISRAALGRPKITLVDQTGLIHIAMTGGSPKEARRRSEAVLAAFFRELDALRVDEQNVREFSGKAAIEDYVDSIRETRAAISDLQVESRLMSSAQFYEQVAANDQLILRVRELGGELERQAAIVSALENTLGLTTRMAAITLKLFADAPYLALRENIAKYEAELADVRSHYGARHPKVQNAREARDGALAEAFVRAVEVTGLRQSAIKGIDRAPMGERAELLSNLVREDVLRAGMVSEFSNLTRRFKVETLRLRNLAPVAAELEDKQRDFAVAEAVFASAIARTQATKTDVYASYPLVQILENPSLPDSPSSPRKKFAIIAGIAATFMLLVWLSLAWVRAFLIKKILKRPDEQAAK
jgi:uncharacterized protein involved in exopolysaccharide biosynthesis